MGKPDIGPRYFCIGNPTTALGAGMLDGGLSRKVTVKPSHRKKNATDVFGNPKHTGNLYLGSAYDVVIEVPRSVATGVDQFSSAFLTGGTFRTPGSSIPQRTLALIHPDFLAGAATAATTEYFHSVDDVEIGDLDYNTDEGDADEEYVAITFRCGYVDETQAATPVPIPANLQPKARGNATGMTALGYTLPNRYA